MRDRETITSRQSIAIIGGGISGITAAVEAAEVGYDVCIIEKSPSLGGRVAQLHQYFPKLCSPYCGLEINFMRMKTNPGIKVFTLAEVESISGTEGRYEVTVRLTPRLVKNNCTACGKCVEVCPVERPNDFNYGWGKTRAIYLPHPMAFPMTYAIDTVVCRGAECSQCVSACPYGAIDLTMPTERINMKCGAVILATGWKPYDATRLDNLGFDNFPNVITNVMMERLAAADGPTQGRIVRPSDGKEVKSIAFVQCAGSRDENHLPYCSAVCCSASLKQATYVKEKNPEARVFIFYIDIRTPGILEDFYLKAQAYENLSLVRGKVAKIGENPQTRNLIVEAEDTALGRVVREEVAMVVLAAGMVPTTAEAKIPAGIAYDDYGFVTAEVPGVYAAGCAKRPTDVATSVRDATGAALKAIQSIVSGRANG